MKWWYLTNFGTSKITVVPARGPHLSHSGVAFLVMMENFIRTSFDQSNLISAATSVHQSSLQHCLHANVQYGTCPGNCKMILPHILCIFQYYYFYRLRL